MDAAAYAAVSGGRTSWSSSWKRDVKSNQIRQSVSIYLRNNPAKYFHPDLIWNDWAYRRFWRAPPQQVEQDKRYGISSWSNKYECTIDQELTVDAA